MKRRLLTTGEMASGSNSTLRTVRFYEDEGLIRPAERTQGGHRKFDPGELDKLRAILDFREAGLALSEIRDLMALKERCNTAHEAASRLSEALALKAHDLKQKITVLQRVLAEINGAMTAIERCRQCDATPFPECCGKCDMNPTGTHPGPAKLLWPSTTESDRPQS